MNQNLEKILKDFNLDITNLKLNESSLENLKNKYLSKKGLMQNVMNLIKDLDPSEKPNFGKDCNFVKNEISNKITALEKDLKNNLLNEKLLKENKDINIPADFKITGNLHPLTILLDKIKTYFILKGYQIIEGPEIELDEYNFERMNIAKDHPARNMHDSLYFDAKTLLRTHTSPVQARVMEENKNQPLKLICPGKVYRKDEEDATHSHQFNQIEGLCLGEGINFINLRETLLDFLRYLFGSEINIRIRPSYFPFTEPSIEVDMVLKDKNNNLKYIEILGAGMVHPNVLKMSGFTESKITGFAFGIGLERIAMLYYKINDIRYFYQNDIRFLKQFNEEII